MFTEQEIYRVFRQEQSKYLDRPYRMPKKWDDFFTKLPVERKDPLITITKFFNTKWSNIDPNLYFKTAFKVFGSGFSYHRFFNRKIIEMYANEDRAIKRETEDVGSDLRKSIEFIKEYIPNGQVSKLFRYVNMFDGERARALSDYLANRIGKYFLVYLIKEGYVKLPSEQRGQLVYIDKQYTKYLNILNTFLQKTGSMESLLEDIS
jgi:hypothetical protein